MSVETKGNTRGLPTEHVGFGFAWYMVKYMDAVALHRLKGERENFPVFSSFHHATLP